MIQRPRLHIIDDDPQYCELVKFHLKNYFLISISNGGFEGYSRTMSQRPDIIILDQHMDGWNGIQTLMAIRDNPKMKHIPVLMITSDASREVVMSVLAAGANGFLRKDQVTAESLLDRLNTILPPKQKLQLSSKK
ncbi:MAG: response regulator [Planctomycetaceae bacterium]|nr:response regulator [Planctomycetaceae bacterium]